MVLGTVEPKMVMLGCMQPNLRDCFKRLGERVMARTSRVSLPTHHQDDGNFGGSHLQPHSQRIC